MRIVAGEWKGRRIEAPKGSAVRPTPERVREAWMSILQNELAGARVLDLFSGTGALGLEALSRGAEHVDFVDDDPRSVRALEQNIASLHAGDRCTIHRTDALRFAAQPRAPIPSICFADPPYRQGLAGRLATLWLAEPFSTIFGV
ncbi:MAG: 16S rRNA (guanine(966)-N(2))-methyltransferase RsmD, partial [Gemmatimonadales bacterium]